MIRNFRHIAAISAILILFLSSCDRDKVQVIPRDDLAHIYAEMMMTDQWILNTPNVRLIADTSLVYEPILEKYGYDSDDYRKSVDVYMDDPERFAKILRETGNLLTGRLNELEARKEEMNRRDKLRLAAEKYRPDLDYAEMFPYLHDEPYVHYYDSVAYVLDSLNVYKMVAITLADTLYDGVRMVLKDTLEVKDTLAGGDPQAIKDSVVLVERPELKAIEEMELSGKFRILDEGK